MRIGFEKDRVIRTVFDMEKFQLRKDQTARIAVLDQQVHCLYLHFVDLSDSPGEAKGRTYLCLGDPKKMEQGNNIVPDTDSCPLCAAAEISGNVGQTTRKFAMNILRYITKNDGTPMSPLNAYVMVWIFGNNRYNDLTQLSSEWNLRENDILVHCEVEKYQNFKLNICKEALWREDSVKVRMATIWKAERMDDLDQLLGRKENADRLEQILSTMGVESMAAGKGSEVVGTTVEASELLGDVKEKPKGIETSDENKKDSLGVKAEDSVSTKDLANSVDDLLKEL